MTIPVDVCDTSTHYCTTTTLPCSAVLQTMSSITELKQNNSSQSSLPESNCSNTSTIIPTTVGGCGGDTHHQHNATIEKFWNPKVKFALAITTITCSSCFLAISLIICTIVLAVMHSMGRIVIHGEIYAILVSILLLFIVIGLVTLLVGIKMWKGKLSVNSQGHVVNSTTGQPVNYLGESTEPTEQVYMQKSPIILKPFNFSNV